MTIQSGFFNSINGDRKYDASWFAQYFASFIGNGVFPNPSNGLQVAEGENMNIVVKSGKGWINGYFVVNDSDYTLTLDNADGVLKRIDRVVIRLNYLTRQIEILVKKGTFASNPVAPNLQRDTEFYELGLADILINNGALQITQVNITDTRLNNELCGIVHGVVNQVDTTTIFNQYESWFGEFSVEKQQEFQQWIDDLRELLEGDVAANLLARIIQTENTLTNLENTIGAHIDTNASTTVKGHVQLNNTVTSTSTTEAATANAVKIAYDRAEQAFQTGNNVKNNTVEALLSVDDGLPITNDSPWATIISEIGNITTGRKWAAGTSGNNTITVTGLEFRPRIIIVKNKSFNSTSNKDYNVFVYLSKDVFGLNFDVSFFTLSTGPEYSTTTISIRNDGFSGNIGFTGDNNWIAFE